MFLFLSSTRRSLFRKKPLCAVFFGGSCLSSVQPQSTAAYTADFPPDQEKQQKQTGLRESKCDYQSMARGMADMHNAQFRPSQAPISVSHRPLLRTNQETGKNIPQMEVDIEPVATHHITMKKGKSNSLSHKPLPTD